MLRALRPVEWLYCKADARRQRVYRGRGPRARAYRDGWVDGHRDAIDSMPPMLRGELEGSEWMRRQMAKELAALGLGAPEALMCELDRYEARVRDRKGSSDGEQ